MIFTATLNSINLLVSSNHQFEVISLSKHKNSFTFLISSHKQNIQVKYSSFCSLTCDEFCNFITTFNYWYIRAYYKISFLFVKNGTVYIYYFFKANNAIRYIEEHLKFWFHPQKFNISTLGSCPSFNWNMKNYFRCVIIQKL